MLNKALSETLSEAKSVRLRRSGKRLYLGIAVLVFLGLSKTEGWAQWDIRVLDSTGNVGMYTSIAGNYEVESNPWISYYDATNKVLKCTRWNGTPEKVDTVGNVGLYTSITVEIRNEQEYPHISYYDATNKDLKYASRDSAGHWTIEKIDTVGDVGMYSSLRFDILWHPHISYYDATNGDLKYAYWNGSQWVIQKVDTTGNVGMYNSLAIADSIEALWCGTMLPYISYYDATNGNLKLAWRDSSGWKNEIIDSAGNVGLYTSASNCDLVGMGGSVSIQQGLEKVTPF